MTVTQDEINIVKARLQNMPPTLYLSIGGHGAFNRDQLLGHLEILEQTGKDEIGELIVRMQMNGIRAFRKGIPQREL